MKNYCRFEQMILRRLCLLVFLLVCTLEMKAQEGFRIGPTAMFISSKSYVPDTIFNNYNFRFKSGLSGGLSIQYGFTSRFILGTGVSFVSKGYRVFNDSNNNGNVIKHNINHLEVPLNLIFRVRMNSSSNMRAIIGGSWTTILSKNSFESSNKNGSFVIREDIQNKNYYTGNLGLEIANENKAGNIVCFGVHYRQAFANNVHLNVSNDRVSGNKTMFALGFRGSYVGVSISYLFKMDNFRKEEQFFY